MQVTYNKRKFKIYWMYNSSVLAQLLKEYKNADYDDVMELPFKSQLEMIKGLVLRKEDSDRGLRIPESPDTTHCFLVDVEAKTTVAVVSVRKHHKDPENRDKARRYSLTKLLQKVSSDDKEVRTQFWNSYHSMINPVIKRKLTAV